MHKDVKLSKSTIHSTFTHLKRFFEWLAIQQGYKSRIQYSDADYFNTSNKDLQVATARRVQKVPTLEQIKHVVDSMSTNTEIQQRNRTLIAFNLLTGARDSAIASAKLKHINLENGSFDQDARDVNKKLSKSFITFFFPVEDEIKQIVIDWIHYLRAEKLYGNDDSIFPMNEIVLNEQQHFTSVGLRSEHWSNASPIRDIFRKSFKQANLPYFNPHSFRNTLVQLGQSKCKTTEAFKAWSQNLGHESVLTTFYSYGEVGRQRQADILKELGSHTQDAQPTYNDFADTIAQKLIERGLKLPA